jgi:hypothetical protein
MDAVRERYQEKVARHIIAELGKKRMAGSFAPTIVQAKEEVLKMIPEGSTVYRCGSTSLAEIGFWEAVSPPVLPSSTFICLIVRRKDWNNAVEAFADIMISARTPHQTGYWSTDGMGNRVAARPQKSCFGGGNE